MPSWRATKRCVWTQRSGGCSSTWRMPSTSKYLRYQVGFSYGLCLCCNTQSCCLSSPFNRQLVGRPKKTLPLHRNVTVKNACMQKPKMRIWPFTNRPLWVWQLSIAQFILEPKLKTCPYTTKWEQRLIPCSHTNCWLDVGWCKDFETTCNLLLLNGCYGFIVGHNWVTR